MTFRQWFQGARGLPMFVLAVLAFFVVTGVIYIIVGSLDSSSHCATLSGHACTGFTQSP